MKKVVIVSTYPENGSKNIGDQLITDSLKQALIDLDSSLEINTVFRADNWDNVKDKFIKSDFILFACLAIRSNMHKVEYPYLEKLIDLNKKVGVVSAGTSLPVSKNLSNLSAGFHGKTVELLQKLSEKAVFFTTRGALTHAVCEQFGLKNIFLSGDIAFYGKNINTRKFVKNHAIKNICISTPHRPEIYKQSLLLLTNGLKKMFPSSRLILVQHGKSDFFKRYALQNDLELVEAYKDRYKGTDIYDDADLHVGFRVHAHVSSLKRKIPSYLFEQDGRGADYGITFDCKCTVPCYPSHLPLGIILKNALKFKVKTTGVTETPTELMLSMIKNDMKNGFSKFLLMDSQINYFSSNHLSYLKKVVS